MSYVVHFNLIEGKNMPAMDVGLFSSSSDLYVITHVGSTSHKSKIIMKSLKPIWNEKFSIKFNNLNDEAIFQVFDYDALSKDDPVGKTSFPISKLSNGKNDLWLQLPQIKNLVPEIHVVMELQPHIRVKVCEGKDLPSMDLGGSSDPFVEISYGKSKFKTKTIKKNLNPQWNETFDFDVLDLTAPLFFHVFDWDMLTSKDPMGKAIITLTSLHVGLNKDIWLPLEKKGAIRVEIEAIGFGSEKKQQVQQKIQQQIQPNFGMQQQFIPQQMQTQIVLPTIIKADYGVQGKTVDATLAFMTVFVKLQQQGKLIGFNSLFLCQELGYDPVPGQVKTLTLHFCPPGTLQPTTAYIVDYQLQNLF